MEYNPREDIRDLDLNQEPLDQPHGLTMELDSIVNGLETTHERIEERIRQLEAVNSRFRQRWSWRQAQTPPLTDNISVADAQVVGGLHSGDIDVATQERRVDCGKTSGLGSTYLIAKALGIDKKEGSTSGGFFDCNICLEMARDPILTSCGHLFCWPCFYHSNVKECPVCRVEVTNTSIIPIYGGGSGNSSSKSERKDTRFMVPPRPHARRIESVRQQLRSQVASSPIEERIHNLVGLMGERLHLQDLDGLRIMAERTNFSASQYQTSLLLHGTETESNQRHRFLQRLLLQGAASFSSLSSALNTAVDSAERLVEDLEAYIHSHHIRRGHQPSPSVDNRDSFSSVAVAMQLESQTPDTATEINFTVPPTSNSSFRSDTVPSVVGLANQTMDGAIEVNSTLLPSSSSSRRRTDVPGVPDLDNGVSREARRRRLR